MRQNTTSAQVAVPIKEPFPSVAKRYAEAQERAATKVAQEKVTPLQMFLPGMNELMRAMPNQMARSSLFAPIAKKSRKMHCGTVLVSRIDSIIEYWGEQLDEADADITLQLMFEAMHSALGQPVKFKRAAFMRAIGRSTGGDDYLWLHRRIKALTAGTLIIQAKKQDGSTKYHIGNTKAFHILADFDYNENMEIYTYTLDPRWRVLFDNKEFALIDWQKRLQIGRGQDMAKALQRLVATSANTVQRYALDWLKEKMQYTGRIRDFRDALNRAMRELQRLKIISEGRIEISTKGKEQATWMKL